MNDIHRQVGDLTRFTPGNETAVAQKDAEIERLRKRLSGALQHLEEARSDLHRIRNQSLDWAMSCPHDCPACDAMYEAIKGAAP